MRDRLLKLLDEAINDESTSYSNIVDYLLENGVIVPPCKVGDTLFFIIGDEIIEDKCTGFWIGDEWLQIQLLADRTFTCWDGFKVYFGKTVFFTREEAEAKLKGEQ